MQRIHFSINNRFIISLKSDSLFEFDEKDLLLLKGHVPGIELHKEEPEKTDYLLEHIQSTEKKVVEEDGKLVIYDSWDERLPGDVTHLLYGISRRLYLSSQQYPVHGACVSLPNKNILIVGHSGAGKTSVTLELLKDTSVSLFSGNKTVVEVQNEQLEAIAGTPTITVRESDVELFNEIEKEQEHEHWGRSTFLLPQHRYTKNESVRIDAVAIVKLTSYKETCNKLDHPSSLHILYPYFMDSVNSDIVLLDFGTVFSGDVAIESKEALVKGFAAISQTTPIYSVTGSTPYIASQLKSI